MFNPDVNYNPYYPSMYNKDNINMNFSYFEKGYNRLFELAYYDDNVSCNELENFRNKYNDNLQKLYFKKSGIIEKQYKELIDYLIKHGIEKVIYSESGD